MLATSVAVLSPHLDDAVLSCWTRLGPGVTVINVFNGRPPPDTPPSVWDRICGYNDPLLLMADRTREDKRAIPTTGADRTPGFGLLEALHRTADVGPRSIAEAIVVSVKPDVELLAPLAGGPKANPDHRLVRDAALLLLDRNPVTLYADIPYCAKGGGWPAIWGGEQNGPRWLGRVERELRSKALLAVADVAVLDDETRDRKRACMDIYVTQMKALDRGLRERGLISNRDVWGREVYVPVVP